MFNRFVFLVAVALVLVMGLCVIVHAQESAAAEEEESQVEEAAPGNPAEGESKKPSLCQDEKDKGPNLVCLDFANDKLVEAKGHLGIKVDDQDLLIQVRHPEGQIISLQLKGEDAEPKKKPGIPGKAVNGFVVTKGQYEKPIPKAAQLVVAVHKMDEGKEDKLGEKLIDITIEKEQKPPLCESIDEKNPNIICIDAPGDKLIVQKKPADFLLTTVDLQTYVRHKSDRIVKISLKGKNDFSKDGVEKKGEKKGGFVVTEKKFSKALPEEPQVKIQLFEKKADGSEAKLDELLIPDKIINKYWGGMRMGLGVVGGNAVDRVYEIKTPSGSEQAELAVEQDPVVNMELILGFAYYFRARQFNYGDIVNPGTGWWSKRSYDFTNHFAPYFGLGLLTPDPAGDLTVQVKAFKSVYAGLEYSFYKNTSIAFTLVAREVTRPSPGNHIGMAVSGSSTDDYTAESFKFGYGLVFNVNVDYWKSFFQGDSIFK